jgi:tetratricopeptide (TPR) repeat protein
VAVLLSVTLATRPVSAQSMLSRLPDDSILQNFSAEFPPNGIGRGYPHRDILTAYAERLLREAPDALDTFEVLLSLERADEAADTLRRKIDARSPDLVRAVELAAATNVSAAVLGPIVAELRALDLSVSREQAARLERVSIHLAYGRPLQDLDLRVDALRAFIEREAGTESAALAEVDLIMAAASNPATRSRQLDEVVGRRAGTTAAARALYEKAQLLASHAAVRGQDPTEPLLEVFAIVRELERGAYPSSEWIPRAPWLVFGARLGDPVFAAGNADRLLAAYLEFVEDHFTLPATGYFAERVRWLFTGPIFDLFERQGGGVAGVERALEDLERVDAGRAQFILGAFYVERLSKESEDARPAILRKARDTLSALASAPGGGLHARRARATLAALDYAEGDIAAALAGYEAYLTAYPDTAWSWVAAMGIAECHQALGATDLAVAAFREAATRYGSLPAVRRQGYLTAGALNEAVFRLEEAADDYTRALESWDWRPGGTRLSGLALETRVSRIRTSLALPGGELLERGRALLPDDRAGATAAVDELLRSYPDSPLAAEARRLLHRVRLDAAIDLIGPASARRDEAAALEALETLGREPWNDIVGIAQILRAALTAARGELEQAEMLLTDALRDWQRQQVTGGVSRLAPEVARDVSDITRLITEDTGAWWRGDFAWSGRVRSPRFRVADPQVTVQVHGGVPQRETVHPPLAAANLLFMTAEQIAMLTSAVNAIHGPRTGFPIESGSGVSRELIDQLAAYLPQRGCGPRVAVYPFGLSLPVVDTVHFSDQARTRAVVGIFTGSGSGGLFLEKDSGVWRVTGVGPTGVC